MWNEILNQSDIDNLMETYGGFHDGCLVNLEYVSGAYVREDLGMIPVNIKRKLNITFQRQYLNPKTIEIEFLDLKFLNLAPSDPDGYDCIIFNASMFWEDGKIYWADDDWFVEQRDEFKGTWICAEKAKWRILD